MIEQMVMSGITKGAHNPTANVGDPLMLGLILRDYEDRFIWVRIYSLVD